MAEFNEHLLEDGTFVVEASGEVDLAVVDQLLEIAIGGLSGARAVCLDLRGVSFIDSTGIGALVLIRNEASAASKSMRLTNVPPAVRRLLALTGLEDAFDIDAPDDA